MLSVSIITISHYDRKKFLEILIKCIKKQTYKNIKEWIIIDTSHTGYHKTNEDLEEFVQNYYLDTELPNILYYKSKKENIGGWRNESSKLVSGDIIVCMDDDDYYPPERISHAVEKLKDKKALIAGCDKLFLYDIHFKKIYQCKGFGEMHSTNNCMAYWREYLDNHKYDELIHNAEENSFTDNFKIPMVQLDPDKTVLQFSHSNNTFNKKKIIISNYFLPPQAKYMLEKTIKLQEFINWEVYQDYEKLFNELSKPIKSPYDIVYYMGISIPWSPHQEDLGGSEQAVKYLTMEWAKQGKKVAVYGRLTWNGNFAGVDYFDFSEFKFWDEFETLIFWRTFGTVPFLDFDIKANKILVDMHDNIPAYHEQLFKNKNKITSWMVKSDFHREMVEISIGQKIPNIIPIPNGIKISDFLKESNLPRDPFRMCYCSNYARGLYRILRYIWPIIYKLEPRSELHIYYGMEINSDPKFKEEMKKLLSQPGVMDHDRQPTRIINREKHLSTFQFYYTDSLDEIDCISIRESLIAGCIPILSNINLFNYRDGIHLQWLPNTPDFNKQIACTVVELMHNTEIQNTLRNELVKSNTIISWEECAHEWLKYI